MTKLNTIPDSSMSITCAVCQHNAVLEVANLLLVVDEDVPHMMFGEGIPALNVRLLGTTRIRLFEGTKR
jgi:hypothetical protein